MKMTSDSQVNDNNQNTQLAPIIQPKCPQSCAGQAVPRLRYV